MKMMYSDAVGVFFQGVLHFSELWLQMLDAFLQVQLSLLAAL